MLTTMLRWLLGLLALAWSLLLIAWSTLHWGILPRIEQWRPQIEARASSALGVPVRIGAISVQSGSLVSGGLVPAFELRDVTLLDGEKRVALQLPRVLAVPSAKSLWTWRLRFDQLLIEGAQLEVRRDMQGRVFVAGLEVGLADVRDAGGATPLRDWFFDQHEFVIRGGSLRWTDERRLAPPLSLTQVELVVRNGVVHHELRLDATPDTDWGERFSLRGRFVQPLWARSGEWQRWSGSAFVDLPRVDVSQLRRHVDLPFDLSQGDGAVRAWLDLADGRPRSVTVDLALRAVALRLASTVEPMAFEQVEGRIAAQRNDDATTVAATRFGFVTGDGIRWPAGDLSLTWRQREGEAVSGGEVSAQRLDLALMAQVASRIPLGDALRKLLDEVNPQGVVSDLAASWQGPLDAPRRYQAKALFSGLTLAARASEDGPGGQGPGRPGLRNATVQVQASETGGQAQLAINGGAIELPGVFEQPVVTLDKLSAALQWKITPGATAGAEPRISVQVKDGKFDNPDLQGDLSGSWATGAGTGFARGGRYPGWLVLDGHLARADATQVARYLPMQIPDTRSYVSRAVLGGRVRAATFRVQGDLWDFPFHTAKTPQGGEFRVAAQVDDASFAYVPSEPATDTRPAWTSPWPPFTRLSGELVIDRASLEIRSAQARLGNVQLGPVQGGIRDLTARPVLTIDGTARGPLAEMLRFVDATPVRDWTGQALAKASGTGNAELKLGLAIPLERTEATTVKGTLALAGNDLRLTPDTPLLGATKGKVEFTQQGFAVVGATARVLGGDLAFEGGQKPDGSVRFTGQGTFSAEGLRRATELGALSQLGSSMNGQAAYRLGLGFVGGQSEFSLTSTLAGLSSDLPAPLRKTAEAVLPLRLQSQLVADGPATPPPAKPAPATRDTVRFELGNVLQAQYARDLSGDTPRVLRGGIGVFEAPPTPAAGVQANISLPLLDIDAWQAVADKAFGSGPGSTVAGISAYAPSQIALQVQALQTGSRQFNRLVAGVSRDPADAGLWRANVESEQVNGYVEYRPGTGAAAGRVYARLARLSLPKTDADRVENLLDHQAPSSVPALDIVVDDFELRGKRLGRVELEAVNRNIGSNIGGNTGGSSGGEPLREWRLNKFSLSTPEAQFSGSGQWSELGGAYLTVPGAAATVRRRAVLDFKLVVNDGGALLERLGTGQAVRGGKGQLSGQIAWLGSPLSLDYTSLSGDVNVAIDKGQFLKAEPGAARLLGVLSLQALPRRLVLDFRDVFQEGFAFDSLTGDLKIAQGVAQTNNLRMRGVQAVVLMEGRADLARETQDLRVVVVPEINAGTAALAYAAINPAIGLGTFLAQALLRRPLTQAGTREFHVSGPWADPKVDKIERKFTDAVPDVDAPLAPSTPVTPPATPAASAPRPGS